MYARVSSALVAQANKVSAAYSGVTSTDSSTTSGAGTAAYTMQCGTLTTSTWPPCSVPVIVTATSIRVPPPPPRTKPSSSAHTTGVDVTSAHPRHPLHLSMARSPMWYTATTRSQRGYALGRSTLNFTTKAAPAAAPAETATTSEAPPASSPLDSHTAASHADVAASNVSSSSGNTTEPSASAAATAAGTVMLPDALVFSFKGNPHEFQDRLRGANVLVFFYKAVCGPCAAIRSRLIHAVTGHFPVDANSFLNGASSHKKAEVENVAAAPGDEVASTANAASTSAGATEGSVEARAAAAPPSPSPPADSHGGVFAAPTETASSMASEDKEACELACRTLQDVAKAFPHRMIFLTVDTNENAKLTALHDIRSLPTFVAYRNGCMMGRVEGADEREVKKLVHSLTLDEEKAETAPEGEANAPKSTA